MYSRGCHVLDQAVRLRFMTVLAILLVVVAILACLLGWPFALSIPPPAGRYPQSKVVSTHFTDTNVEAPQAGGAWTWS